jgi:hypothetical protein
MKLTCSEPKLCINQKYLQTTCQVDQFSFIHITFSNLKYFQACIPFLKNYIDF